MKPRGLSLLAVGAFAVMVGGCRNAEVAEDVAAGVVDAQEAATTAEWHSLLEEDNLASWRGYKRDQPPAGWTVRDGVLTLAPGAERGDLMTRESFGDFELALEWLISEGGNSGIIFRISEQGEATWHTGPEIQVIDDDRHPDALLGKDRNHTAGALYDLIGPPAGVVRPAGQWNEARIIARGNRLEHYLNGQKVVDTEIGSIAWNQLLAASKFASMPGFGAQPEGFIALQDHGNVVSYRNIRIRRL